MSYVGAEEAGQISESFRMALQLSECWRRCLLKWEEEDSNL